MSGRGRSFSFLHLFIGGQVVAKDSRVVLHRSRVVGGRIGFTFYISSVVVKW